MQIKARHNYHGTCQQIIEMMRNKDFLSKLAKRSHAHSYQIDIVAETARLSLTIPSPDTLKKVIGSTLTLDLSFVWEPRIQDLSCYGYIDIKVPSFPITMHIKSTLTQTDNICQANYCGDLKVAIPLIGSFAEKAATPTIVKALDTIQELADEWFSKKP